jgi:hypothetical protein
MESAERLFGFLRPDVDTELSKFYDKAEKALTDFDPTLAPELKFRSSLPLGKLPFKQRAGLMRDYRKIIGLDEALLGMAGGVPDKRLLGQIGKLGIKDADNSKIANIFSGIKTASRPGDTNPYGRMPTPVGQDTLSRIYSNMNLQFNKDVRVDRVGMPDGRGSVTAASHFSIGADSVPSRRIMDGTQYQPGMLAGKKVLTYDLETAGLSLGQIREVAYTTQKDGIISSPKPITFTPKEFNRGLVNVNGKASPLRTLLSSRYGIDSPVVSSGEDFANGVKGFLKEMADSDYIVGHNISGFDNEQLFVGLSRTKQYKEGGEFAELVDKAALKARTKTIDTLDLVKQMPGLEGLKTSSLLGDSGRPYSIANLLLNTDLVDKIGLDELGSIMGYDPAAKKFGKGLHHASVDTAVTNAIMQSAENGGLKAKSFGQGLSGSRSVMAQAIKAEIQKSAAITPITNLGDASQLLDTTLSKLAHSKDSLSHFGTTKRSQLGKLLSGSSSDRELAISHIRRGTNKDYLPNKIGVSAVEQEILEERNLGRLGERSGSLLGRMQSMKPGSKAPSGLPFSGLSSAERGMGYSISKATSGLSSLGDQERKIASIGSDSLIARFDTFTADAVQYSTKSGNISLPGRLLGNQGLKSGEMLSMSMVEPTSLDQYGAINLNQNLDKKSGKALGKRLDRISSGSDAFIARVLGVEEGSKAVANFRTAIDEGLVEKVSGGGRVAIGQIYAGTDDDAVSSVGSIFKQFFNTEKQLTDQEMGRFRLPALDLDIGGGRVRTAGVILDKGIASSEVGSIQNALTATRTLDTEMGEIAGNSTRYRQANALANASDTNAANVRRAYAFVEDKIAPNMRKGSVGLLAAGVSALLFNKYKENQTLNETLEFQGHEGPAQGQYGIYEQIQARVETGYDGYEQRVDPLATASVNYHLNENKIGHSNYSWNRSNSVYGGVL